MTDTDVLTAHDLSRHIKYIWHTDEQSVEEIKKRDAAIEARAVAAKDEEIRRLREDLEMVGLTAEMASMHEPEQFCEWASNYVHAALKSSGETL